MEVLDDTESDWWRVIVSGFKSIVFIVLTGFSLQHLTTRQEGLIPWNFVAEERSVNSEE